MNLSRAVTRIGGGFSALLYEGKYLTELAKITCLGAGFFSIFLAFIQESFCQLYLDIIASARVRLATMLFDALNPFSCILVRR